MPKKNQNDFPSGFLIVNKPSGPTSHDMVNRLRKITGIKKIGHAGTLDPAASGVLIVGVGREATKKLGQLIKLDKEYAATIRLGATSDTYDREGIITPTSSKKAALSKIKAALNGFIGEIVQIPPIYSAKKFQGKKLYELARAGKSIRIKPVKIKIYLITFINYVWPDLKINVSCSSGTYIRSLAHDLGQALGCGSFLADLKRISVGKIKIKQAIKINENADTQVNQQIIMDKMIKNIEELI